MYGYEIFHEKLIDTLLGNVREGKNANTYIFEGAKGLSRHNAALLFAKSLVCDNTTQAPCCSCRSCIDAQAGTHPDIIFVEKEKDKATLGIKPIRAMVSECLIKPFYNRHKVFIINDGDALTPEAQNAFLKIIEEPPEYAVFIIVCSDAQILLQTVRSRSVTVTFPPVSDDIVRGYIEEKYPDEARTDFLVKYCAGIPKAADDIIAREDFEQLREDALGLVPKILSQKKVHAFAVADYFEKNKTIAAELYDMILMYLRDALVTVMGQPAKIINADKADKINIIASKYPSALIVRAIDEVVYARKMLDRYVKASATALHAALKTRTI
ncbi:MAG: ATP-binding protein [Candidatus Ornithomonoglobus sp.]